MNGNIGDQDTYWNASGFAVHKQRTAVEVDPSDLQDLSPEQQEVMRHALAGRNVMQHGPAGTGKSVVLGRLVRAFNKRGWRVALVAPTGAAAVAIGGTTIHSLFKGLGLMKEDAAVLIKKLLSRRCADTVTKLRSLQVLVIDEISMVSSSLFDKVDLLFRAASKVDLPFGGKQLILSGDCFQLPPVESCAHGGRFVFEASVWAQLRLHTVEMQRVFRQANRRFVDLLAKVRVGDIGVEELHQLIQCVDRDLTNEAGVVPTSLVATNAEADALNARELEKLPGQARRFEASVQVEQSPTHREEDHVRELFRLSTDVAKYCRVPQELDLKVGAQVLLRYNLELEAGLANGSRGVVARFSEHGAPVVRFLNGVTRTLEPFVFEHEYPVGKVSVRQIPLVLAWALTVHKAQGATLDLVHVSMQHMRTDGQAYVALSRVRSPEGLSISHFSPGCIRASETVRRAFAVVPTCKA